MSFYGNISNAGRTNLTFDKIYPNRELMELKTSEDGVFVGRHILIEYDDNTFSRRRGYLSENDIPTLQNVINAGGGDSNMFYLY
jgi:hypothetical protein